MCGSTDDDDDDESYELRGGEEGVKLPSGSHGEVVR